MKLRYISEPEPSTEERHSASVIYIDPPMARRILEKNTRNRPLSDLHVRRLLDEMLSGRWKYNGESIKWSVANQLLDGQHRLTALSRVDDNSFSLPFLVVLGLPPESQDTMDQGRTRTAGDQLHIKGIATDTNAKIIAGAIRVYIQWQEGKFFGDQCKIGNKIGNPQVIDWADRHPVEVQIMVELLCQDLRRVKARPSLTLAIVFHFYEIDADATQEFTSGLYRGIDLSPGNPILTLRDRLDRIKTQGLKMTDRDLVAFFVLAWNAWRQGRSMTKFQRPTGGTWSPENYPQAI